MAMSSGCCIARCFNPRSRAGSDTVSRWHCVRLTEFQSTLPRGERLDGRHTSLEARPVSIHAPARGATPIATYIIARRQMFQSTLPRGERPTVMRPASCVDRVSIHAPARGATRRSRPILDAECSFNPRSRAGSDWHAIGCRIDCMASFNPRSRAGSDQHELLLPMRHASCFNPRSRAGSDRCHGPCHGWSRSVSIHAPARGATCVRMAYDLTHEVFQSTLPRGERRWHLSDPIRVVELFQSTLPRGERPDYAMA